MSLEKFQGNRNEDSQEEAHKLRISEALGISANLNKAEFLDVIRDLLSREQDNPNLGGFLDLLSDEEVSYLDSILNPNNLEFMTDHSKEARVERICTREEVTSFLDLDSGASDQEILKAHIDMQEYNESIDYSMGDPLDGAPLGYENYILSLETKKAA